MFEKYRTLGQFFCVEENPSRGKPSYCRVCSMMIGKGEIRLRHLVCSSQCFKDQGKHKAMIDSCGRYHIQCLLNSQTEKLENFTNTNPEFTPITSTRQLAGFDELSPNLQAQVIVKLGPRKRSLLGLEALLKSINRSEISLNTQQSPNAKKLKTSPAKSPRIPTLKI